MKLLPLICERLENDDTNVLKESVKIIKYLSPDFAKDIISHPTLVIQLNEIVIETTGTVTPFPYFYNHRPSKTPATS
jgi:hypothetical protein